MRSHRYLLAFILLLVGLVVSDKPTRPVRDFSAGLDFLGPHRRDPFNVRRVTNQLHRVNEFGSATNFEFDITAVSEHVVNLDELDGLLRLVCSLHSLILTVDLGTMSADSELALRQVSHVTASDMWGCGAIFRRIIAVSPFPKRSRGMDDVITITLQTRNSSFAEIFPQARINFQFAPSEAEVEHHARRLLWGGEYHNSLGDISFNYDFATDAAVEKSLSIFNDWIKCTDCYMYLGVGIVFQFYVEYSELKEFKLYLDARARASFFVDFVNSQQLDVMSSMVKNLKGWTDLPVLTFPLSYVNFVIRPAYKVDVNTSLQGGTSGNFIGPGFAYRRDYQLGFKYDQYSGKFLPIASSGFSFTTRSPRFEVSQIALDGSVGLILSIRFGLGLEYTSFVNGNVNVILTVEPTTYIRIRYPAHANDNCTFPETSAGISLEAGLGGSYQVGPITLAAFGYQVNAANALGVNKIVLRPRGPLTCSYCDGCVILSGASTAGNCSDGKRNNGEEQIDCSGPCPVCVVALASCTSRFIDAPYAGRRRCPPGCTSGVVWGSNPYTSDSALCVAAVHSGFLTSAGGEIVVANSNYLTLPNYNFSGTLANGIPTFSWGYGDASVTILTGAVSCFDGVKNGNETGIDSGSNCGPPPHQFRNSALRLEHNIAAVANLNETHSLDSYIFDIPKGTTEVHFILESFANSDCDLFVSIGNVSRSSTASEGYVDTVSMVVPSGVSIAIVNASTYSKLSRYSLLGYSVAEMKSGIEVAILRTGQQYFDRNIGAGETHYMSFLPSSVALGAVVSLQHTNDVNVFMRTRGNNNKTTFLMPPSFSRPNNSNFLWRLTGTKSEKYLISAWEPVVAEGYIDIAVVGVKASYFYVVATDILQAVEGRKYSQSVIEFERRVYSVKSTAAPSILLDIIKSQSLNASMEIEVYSSTRRLMSYPDVYESNNYSVTIPNAATLTAEGYVFVTFRGQRPVTYFSFTATPIYSLYNALPFFSDVSRLADGYLLSYQVPSGAFTPNVCYSISGGMCQFPFTVNETEYTDCTNLGGSTNVCGSHYGFNSSLMTCDECFPRNASQVRPVQFFFNLTIDSGNATVTFDSVSLTPFVTPGSQQILTLARNFNPSPTDLFRSGNPEIQIRVQPFNKSSQFRLTCAAVVSLNDYATQPLGFNMISLATAKDGATNLYVFQMGKPSSLPPNFTAYALNMQADTGFPTLKGSVISSAAAVVLPTSLDNFGESVFLQGSGTVFLVWNGTYLCLGGFPDACFLLPVNTNSSIVMAISAWGPTVYRFAGFTNVTEEPVTVNYLSLFNDSSVYATGFTISIKMHSLCPFISLTSTALEFFLRELFSTTTNNSKWVELVVPTLSMSSVSFDNSRTAMNITIAPVATFWGAESITLVIPASVHSCRTRLYGGLMEIPWDRRPAPTCVDGIKNSDETGIDVGGHCISKICLLNECSSLINALNTCSNTSSSSYICTCAGLGWTLGSDSRSCVSPPIRCAANECQHRNHSENECLDHEDGTWSCLCDAAGGWTPTPGPSCNPPPQRCLQNECNTTQNSANVCTDLETGEHFCVCRGLGWIINPFQTQCLPPPQLCLANECNSTQSYENICADNRNGSWNCTCGGGWSLSLEFGLEKPKCNPPAPQCQLNECRSSEDSNNTCTDLGNGSYVCSCESTKFRSTADRQSCLDLVDPCLQNPCSSVDERQNACNYVSESSFSCACATFLGWQPTNASHGCVLCPLGSSNCSCLSGRCGPGLTCNTNQICVPVFCPLGSFDCPCNSGACDPALSCTSNSCVCNTSNLELITESKCGCHIAENAATQATKKDCTENVCDLFTSECSNAVKAFISCVNASNSQSLYANFTSLLSKVQTCRVQIPISSATDLKTQGVVLVALLLFLH